MRCILHLLTKDTKFKKMIPLAFIMPNHHFLVTSYILLQSHLSFEFCRVTHGKHVNTVSTAAQQSPNAVLMRVIFTVGMEHAPKNDLRVGESSLICRLINVFLHIITFSALLSTRRMCLHLG